MDIFKFFLASAGLWVLFQWWLVPALRKSVPPLISRTHIPRIALACGAETVCKLLMLTALVAGLASLAVSYVTYLSGIDLGQVKAAIDTLESWQAELSAWSFDLSVIFTGLLVTALIYTSYRSGKKTMEERWDEAFNIEFKRLAELKASDELEPLEPNAAMDEVAGKIAEYEAVRKELEPKDPDAAQKLLKALNEMAQYYHLLDIERRVEVKVSAADAEELPTWMKLVRPLISQGTLTTARAGAAMLSTILTMLLVLSFLTVSATSLNAVVGTKLIELHSELETLTITANLQQAEREWQQFAPEVAGASEKNAENPQWIEDDQTLADALGAEFESNVMDARLYGRTGRVVTRAIQSSYTRQKILNARAAVDGGGKVVNVAAAGTDLERGVTELLLTDPERRVPQTDAGRRFASDLKQVARHNPDKWQSISTKAKKYFQSFTEVPAPRQLRGMLISNSLGNLTGSVGLDNSLGKIGAEIVQDLPADVASKLYNAESKRFMARMVSEPDMRQAVRSMETVGIDMLPANRAQVYDQAVRSAPDTQRLSELWRTQPPAYQRTAGSQANTGRAAQTLDRYASLVGRSSMQHGGTEVLASFADYFPGYPGAELKTSQAKVAAQYKPAAVTPKVNGANASRARSFYRLRGFARVGGVLIGRPPEDPDQLLPVSRLHWEKIENGGFRLSLIREAEKLELGVFDPELVALALAYAADGRPTTVTMVTASPLTELKILIHPTLEDTGVGCLATRLDQMVDETTSEQTSLKILLESALLSVRQQHALYELSWAVRARFLAENDRAISAQMLHQVQLDEVVERLSKRALENGVELGLEALGTPTGSRDFMRAKPMFYDGVLVQAMEACVQSESPQGYASCIRKQSAPLRDEYDERLRWTAPPPEFQPWSGVREAAYTLDENAGFTKWSLKAGQLPVEFTYQLAFKTPAYLVESTEPWYREDNDAVDQYFDVDPWEFEGYKQLINDAIVAKADSDADYQMILSSTSQFVILQRIFRLALAGHFGEGFAEAQLATLAADATAYIKPVPTRRWLSRAGQIEAVFLSRSMDLLADAPDAQKTERRLSLCRKTAEAAGGHLEVAALPSSEWERNCLLEATYAGEDLAQFSQMVSLVRQLRFDMGVVDEDAKWGQGMICVSSY